MRTNFLLIVLFTSVIVFSFLDAHRCCRGSDHLAIMPLVAGLSYEVIRQAGKDDCHPVFKWLAKPGMALQYFTTKEQTTVKSRLPSGPCRL